MNKTNVQMVRDYLVLSRHEVDAPDGAIKTFNKCVIKGNLSMWEQGAVCGYMEVRGAPHAVVAYSERPFDDKGMPQFDIVQVARVRPFRKIVEREFRL